MLIITPQQTRVVLNRGKYKFELWGAQGGKGNDDSNSGVLGGRGAYVSGEITINKTTTFYLFVGEKGKDGNPTAHTKAQGGFNGGGTAGADDDNDGSGGGGGATDIRLVNGTFNAKESLISRIIVAAGGSGSAYNSYGAPGGSSTGYLKSGYKISDIKASTTTQIAGNSLGVGGNGVDNGCTPSSGAGGGYYGGISSVGKCSDYYGAVSSSGSSFVSGHDSCVAVDENGNPGSSSIHYSGLHFTYCSMLSGNEYFYSPSGTKVMGNEGNGAIRITAMISQVNRVTKCVCRRTFGLAILLAQIVLK